jgi:serine/threonine-protein kinase
MAGGDQTVAALRDEKSHVRVAAVRSLGERREVSSLQFLMSALHDPAWEVRAAAVWALSAFGGQAPAEVLIEALDDEDGSVRAAALRVLAGVRGHVPSESLERMLDDTDWQVHEAVALTLEELGEQTSQGPSVARLRDENTIGREATQMPGKQSHPDIPPSLPFTPQRAMQIEVMGERYQLQDPIGRGGMATIYRGRDLQMDRVVAIKVLREVYNINPKFVQRFQLEAKAASALQHPNIVQVYDWGQTEGKYYIVMELVEGTDLRRYLHFKKGVLDTDRSVIIAHDVALGLGAAHRRGIVHRDVKPQNILVGHDGSIKLTDFGIVSVYKDIDPERLTTTGMTLGTVQYFAPEQAQGEIVSPAADVYSLGIVMYEMLTGRPPFDGNSPVAIAMQHIQDPPTPPRQLNPTIPPALEEIILRCLEKVPEMRFRDGSQLARALETLGDAKLAESVPVTAGQAPTPTTSNHIPSRPGNSRRDGTIENVPPHSPENGMGPGVPSDQNDADLVPGSLVSQPVYPNQQSFAPPPGSAASHRFRRGTVPRSGVVQPAQRNARFANIITIPILLAILLLLGFSIFLATRPGFITLPFINGTGTSNPTTSVATATVPNLHGDTFEQARQAAQQAGFNLQLSAGSPTTGVVIGQSPPAGILYPRGSTIEVILGPITAAIPAIPQGATLASYEAILRNAGFSNYKSVPDGVDPNLPPNTVSRVNPTPGTPYDVTKLVTIYVKNDTTGTPVASPTSSPAATPGSTTSPTPKPSPSPTPSPTPKPDPTPTPTAFMLQEW